MIVTAEQYGRMKGADWFPFLYKKDVMVLGQGGIGSWLSLLLGRAGCSLHLYDHDKYEGHNMSGQIVRQKDIGKQKSVAVKDVIAEFSPDTVVDTYGKYEQESDVNDIIVCGFDNMAARKLAFTKWAEYVNEYAPDKSKCFFQDGRLNLEQLQIFNIPGNRPDLIDKYAKEYLFDSSEVIVQPACTAKQTSHCAAMIAGHMVGFLTNWAFNASKGKVLRQVPFYYQYVVPINFTENVKP